MCCGLSFVRHIQIEAAFVREKNLNSLQSFRGDTCDTKDAGPKKKKKTKSIYENMFHRCKRT